MSVQLTLQGVSNQARALYADAVHLHKKWYLILTVTLVILIILYVAMSYTGNPGVIALVNALLILVLGFYVSSPAAFLSLFAAGMVSKFAGYDWQLANLFRRNASVFPNVQVGKMAQEGFNLYVAALKLPVHFLIVTISSGIVLGLFRIENPLYALVFFPALATLGMWVFAHNSESKWYRNITLAILVVGIVSSLYMAFVDKPAKPGYPLAPVASGAKNAAGFVSNFFYEKTFDIEVASLEPHILCGVQKGKRTFTVPRSVEVFIGDEKTDITSALRVNRTVSGEEFLVKENGCVEISFAVNEGFKENPFEQQIIALKFE